MKDNASHTFHGTFVLQNKERGTRSPWCEWLLCKPYISAHMMMSYFPSAGWWCQWSMAAWWHCPPSKWSGPAWWTCLLGLSSSALAGACHPSISRLFKTEQVCPNLTPHRSFAESFCRVLLASFLRVISWRISCPWLLKQREEKELFFHFSRQLQYSFRSLATDMSTS